MKACEILHPNIIFDVNLDVNNDVILLTSVLSVPTSIGGIQSGETFFIQKIQVQHTI